MAFYLIDKPVGPTSFDIVRSVRRQLGIRKVGHAGTLDPLASGLLLVATGTSTRLLEYLSQKDKQYEACMRLDGVSRTDDSEGPISDIPGAVYVPELDMIQSVIEQEFLGDVSQTPSAYSAVKVDGQRAYEVARKGKSLALPSRQITIYAFEILSYHFPTLHARLHVSSGTYIRSIARDLGSRLTGGGYVQSLRRLAIGCLSIQDARVVSDIEDLDTNNQIPYEEVFSDIGFLSGLTSDQQSDLALGKKGVVLPEISQGKYFVRYADDSVGLVDVDSHGGVRILKNNV